MLIGLLLTAFLIFGGSHQTFLLNPDMKKNVNEFVKDKSRKDQINQLIKQTMKSETDFQKKIEKPTGKKLVDLNMNRSSVQNQFSAIYDTLYDSLESLQTGYINTELKIQSLLHPAEWDSIMNRVLKQPERGKISKSILAKNKKLHDQLLNACNKRMADSAAREKAKVYVDEYLVHGNALANAFLDLNYKYIASIRPYSATRADFEKPRQQMIDLRKNYSDYLVNMRYNLMALTPEKEWPGLAKELNNDFDYLGAGAKR
jgi:hypothetical protein